MDIIKKPILTEKMLDQTDKFNRYGFIVDKKATKPQIKKAIEDLYGVKVVAIRTMIYPAKKKMKFTKRGILRGTEGAYKKAIVELAEGQNIDFYNH